jgi:hypothetical protein
MMLRPWYGARGREVADGPLDRRRARPAGTTCVVRQRVARARTPARCGARVTSEAARPGVAADLGWRTPWAAHECERRGQGARARRGRGVAARRRGRPILCC